MKLHISNFASKTIVLVFEYGISTAKDVTTELTQKPLETYPLCTFWDTNVLNVIQSYEQLAIFHGLCQIVISIQLFVSDLYTNHTFCELQVVYVKRSSSQKWNMFCFPYESQLYCFSEYFQAIYRELYLVQYFMNLSIEKQYFNGIFWFWIDVSR